MKNGLAFAVAGILLTVTLTASGGLGDAAKARADKNKDGVVNRKDVRAKRTGVDTPAEAKAKKLKRAAVVRKVSGKDRPWEKDADSDNDGSLTQAELRAYHLSRLDANSDGKITKKERQTYWAKWPVVNPAVEGQYDKNGNGFLEWSESEPMLKDQLTIVKRDGQTSTHTDIDLEFDPNTDGTIDPGEAAALEAAVGGD